MVSVCGLGVWGGHHVRAPVSAESGCFEPLSLWFAACLRTNRYCEHNPNKDYASCDVPQELTNEEIDAAGAEDDAASSGEDVSAGRGSCGHVFLCASGVVEGRGWLAQPPTS